MGVHGAFWVCEKRIEVFLNFYPKWFFVIFSYPFIVRFFDSFSFVAVCSRRNSWGVPKGSKMGE